MNTAVPAERDRPERRFSSTTILYESDITRGLNVYRVSDPAVAGAIRLSHLNPQTQEFTIP